MPSTRTCISCQRQCRPRLCFQNLGLIFTLRQAPHAGVYIHTYTHMYIHIIQIYRRLFYSHFAFGMCHFFFFATRLSDLSYQLWGHFSNSSHSTQSFRRPTNILIQHTHTHKYIHIPMRPNLAPFLSVHYFLISGDTNNKTNNNKLGWNT